MTSNRALVRSPFISGDIPSELSTETMRHLLDVIQSLSLSRSLTDVMNLVRSAARQLADADGASFVLREGDLCHYADEDAISPLWKGKRFPMSSCISGWVMIHKKPATIENIFDDARIPIEAYRPTFVKSLVMVPIRTQAPIGAIGVYYARQRSFSAEEVSVLQALADSVSIAIENVNLYAELEERVQLRTHQLERLNAELEAFSYSVSHDLRAPLRTIDGFSEILASDFSAVLPKEGHDHLARIRQAAQRMGQLIDDLLNLSRVSRVELTHDRVDLSALADTIVATLQASDPRRSIRVVIQPDLHLSGDPALFRIVLENLFANAWKFTSRQPEALVEFGQTVANGKSVFFIKDNGVGFDPTFAGKLFSPFQRFHKAEEFPGTGIGLAIVSRVLMRHEGRIWAESAPGQGATFYFTV